VRQTKMVYYGTLRCNNFGGPVDGSGNPKSPGECLFSNIPTGPGSVIPPDGNYWLMFWPPCQRRKIRTLNIRSRSWN